MSDKSRKARLIAQTGLAGQLARDSAGNTLAMIAAAVIPLMALVGGGVDMGRSYLAQTRLQQACDAGVLAARKKMGTTAPPTGTPPADIKTVGDKFFGQNFRSGAYATKNRSFTMNVESDYAITGVAKVDVPTTVMFLFGYKQMALTANCQAKLNFSNTDILFVLDTTGSMLDTNKGDTDNKLTAMKKTVKDFYTQMEASKSPGTRLRYGFLPYSTNVNVGLLLKSDWLVDDWTYHGRVPRDTGKDITYTYNDVNWTWVSGTTTAIGPYNDKTCPTNSYSGPYSNVIDNPDGSGSGTKTENGIYYYCNLGADGSTYTISGTQYNNYINNYVRSPNKTGTRRDYEWIYKPVTQNLAFLKGATGNDFPKAASVAVQMYGYPSPNPGNIDAWFRGCIEERDTYEIDDYANVDLSKALDLDIDLIPTKGDKRTQWRPMLNEISFEPEIWWDGSGTFKSPANSSNDYLMAGWGGFSACPAPARKLAEMTGTEVDDYLNTLVAEGSTYHDIGMIWGGRLLSPTGLFAAENASAPGKSTSRHMIFLTDGLTAPLKISYGTYGIEPLDERRWNAKSPKLGYDLPKVVEERFGVACSEVKKRNITVWVIGFGTELNPIMEKCAGVGHHFTAKTASELNSIFGKIAAQMGDLRISK